MRPQSAKAKGRSLQKWVCEKIAEVTGFECGRDKPIESRPMGQAGADVRLERSVLNKFPFSVECKFQERWSVQKWIEQAKANEAEGTKWLLVCKQSRKQPVVILDAEAFFEIVKKAGMEADE
jgi:hypothetical protein